MKPILVDSVFGKKDYLAYCRFRSYYISKTRFNVYFFPLLLIAFVALNIFLGNVGLTWFLLAIVALLPVWMEISLRMYSASAIEQHSLAEPRKVYSLVFQHDKITVRNKTESASYPLDKIWKICRTKRYIYVFVTVNRGFIIPLESFKKGEADELCKEYQKILKKEQMAIKKPFYEKAL